MREGVQRVATGGAGITGGTDVLLRRMGGWAWVLLFLAIGLVIAYAGRASIFANNMEVGDFAANSVLIQDAKTLSLWVGNYSRVQFNHPGPAILYVLAAGEIVLHDWLHLVPSPFSGQLAAVAFYNAAWITVLAVLFRRMFGSVRQAILATAAFVTFTALNDPQFLNGIWFPHLYYFPFAVALVAFARLAGGDTDSLASLAVAGGFLFNGHVSFGVILVVMAVCVLAYNRLWHSNEPGRILLAPSAYRSHGRRLWIAVAIVLAFCVPLAVMTVKAYPGPLADYARFGGGRPANSLAASIQFTSVYWGGVGPFMLGMLLCGVLLDKRLANAMSFTALPDVVAAVLAATVAVLLYAAFGVDLLNYPYIAFFYYGAPALVGSVALVLLLRRLEARIAASPRLVVIVSIALVCYFVVLGWSYLRDPVAATLLALYAVVHDTIYGTNVLDRLDTRIFNTAAALIVAAVSLLWLREQKGRRLESAPYVLIGAVLVAICYDAAEKPPGYAAMYRQSAPAELVRALEDHKRAGRVVLMLDSSNGWDHVWFTVAGAEAIERREGKDLFCIGRNWHILFTKAAKCSPAELEGDTRYIIAKAGAVKAPGEEFTAAGLSFRRFGPPDLASYGSLRIREQAEIFRAFVLGEGWSSLEGDHVWTDDGEATLSFKLPDGYSGTVLLDLAAYLPREDDVQHVDILSSGHVLARADFNRSQARKTVEVPIAGSRTSGTLLIRVSRPQSPSSAGVSSDTRRLGVALYSIGLKGR